MSNRPYTPHDWVTGELITAGKMNNIEQALSNLDADVYSDEGSIVERIDQIVKVSEEQPYSGYNKVWAQPSTEDGVAIPTMTDWQELKNAIHELDSDNLSALDANEGTIPTAKGDGTWNWENPVVTSRLGTSLIPIYIGDYMSYDAGVQSMCVVGDKVYTANVKGDTYQLANHTDTGLLRVFDITNNVELTELSKEIPCGHANSMCYDYSTENFYIAPMFTYLGDTKQDAFWINKFDKNFNFIEQITTPTLAQAVSYDPVQNILYYYGWSLTCYKRTGNSWTKVCNFDNSGIRHQIDSSHNRFNQDFAVYNGRYYLSSASDNFVSGLLKQGTSRPDSSYVYMCIESRGRFMLGETEGMEFTPDGHLFASNATNFINNITDNFIVELPVGTQVPYATNLRGNFDQFKQGQVVLSDTTVKRFALQADEIRSLIQLKNISPRNMISDVWIQGNVVEDTIIRIDQDVMLELGGHYTCQQFQIYSGHTSFRPLSNRSDDDWHITLTTSSYPIELQRTGKLTFCGTRDVRFNLPNRSSRAFVYMGDNKCMVFTSYVPSNCNSLGRLQAASVDFTYDMIQVGGIQFPRMFRSMTKHYTENNYVTSTDFKCALRMTSGYTPGVFTINITLNQVLPPDTEVQIGQFECTADQTWKFNVASTMGGANLQVSLGTKGQVKISTTGTTLSGDSYCTAVACYLSDDNW